MRARAHVSRLPCLNTGAAKSTERAKNKSHARLGGSPWRLPRPDSHRLVIRTFQGTPAACWAALALITTSSPVSAATALHPAIPSPALPSSHPQRTSRPPQQFPPVGSTPPAAGSPVAPSPLHSSPPAHAAPPPFPPTLDRCSS